MIRPFETKISRRQLVVFTFIALLVGGSIGGAPARAADQAAGAFVKTLGERAVQVLSDKTNTTFSEREAEFRDLFIDAFHIKTISRFVLGRYWKTATEAQRSDYSDIFVDFIVRVYAARFDAYEGENFEVLQVVDGPSERDTIVRTQILRPSGGAPVVVDYRVRQIDGAFKVIDVNVEGISMLHTHRVEFASVINRKGVDGLIADLRSRVGAQADTAVN